MHQRIRTFIRGLRLFLSACLAAAGLVGLVYVVEMGVLPPDNPMGHTKEYQQGWTLVFMLLLGVPSLAAFIGGVTPLLRWSRKLRKQGRH